MRVTTLKASPASLGGLLAYYGGLADDQSGWDGVARGPVDYYLGPAEPPGRWWGQGCVGLGLDGEVRPEQLEALLTARRRAPALAWDGDSGPSRPGPSTPPSRPP